jgi:transcriptional regulator with GAF, ATPase, and Fis domain
MTAPRRLVIGVIGAAVIQIALLAAAARSLITPDLANAAVLATAWAALLILAVVMSRRVDALAVEVQARRDEHQIALDQVEQLAALNEMLLTLGQSRDVGLAFQALARRVARLIPCDRLGLALIKDNGHELQTYSARVSEPERRRRPRPELEFNLDHSVFGQVIRTCEPIIVDDLAHQAADFHDASVMASEGFKSALILPLLSRNRAIGALTVISRRAGSFTPAHRDALQPLAEVLAFAFVVEQQHTALAKFRTMETLAEMSLALAADINSALQTIVGQGGLLQHTRPEIAADVDVIMVQAERIGDLLDRMRNAADDRLREASAVMGAGIPSSPEAFVEQEED